MAALPGTWQPGRVGGLANPLDYSPAPAHSATTLSSSTTDTTTSGSMTRASPAAGGSFAVASATGFSTPPATTLSADLDVAAREFHLTSGAGFPTSGEVAINSERIAYGSLSGTTCSDVIRGVGGTTVAAHVATDAVNGFDQVVVESEIIGYHTLVGTTLGNVVRDSPAAHSAGVVCAPSADIVLASGVGYPTAGLVRIGGAGGEECSYTARSGATLSGVSRAVNGTTAAAHSGGAAAHAMAYQVVTFRDSLILPNADAANIAAGTMVGWTSVRGAGVGVVLEGEPVVGVAMGTILELAYGSIRAGGVASFPRDSAYAGTFGACEPVFAVSGTTVKALADADSGDVAIGRVIRQHDVDTLGATLTNPVVDFVMLSQMVEPYTER